MNELIECWERLAKLFHDEYERLAPEYGYKTREASAVPWNDVPENNRNLMIATVKSVITEAGLMCVPEDLGDLRDEYHSINELYEFRKMYNAALFNEWSVSGKYSVHKSKKHHDGEDCFGGGWFIVVAMLPDGQITNHYKLTDWDLFKVPEIYQAKFEYDGHTGADVLLRLENICL
jgi:hypothetical protein